MYLHYLYKCLYKYRQCKHIMFFTCTRRWIFLFRCRCRKCATYMTRLLNLFYHNRCKTSMQLVVYNKLGILRRMSLTLLKYM